MANVFSLLGAGVSGLSSIFGGKEQANAINNAAQLQSQAQANALGFSKQQAEAEWQNEETNRQANYQQWATQQARKGSIGQMFGLPGVTIPNYVPSVNPNFTGQPGQPTPPLNPGGPPTPSSPAGIGGYAS